MTTHDPMASVGVVTFGGITVPILQGQACSYQGFESALRDEPEGVIIKAYGEATGDERWNVDFKSAFAALSYTFIRRWYQMNDIDVPPYIQKRIDAALIAAKNSTTNTEEDADTPRLSFKKFLMKNLLLGRTEEAILADADQHYPNVKNRRTALVYWRNKIEQGMIHV